MYTRIAAGLLIWVTFPILAQNIDHAAEHGGQLYHRLQIDVSGGIAEHDQHLFDWELDGWIGSDENRLKIDAYGLYKNGSSEQAELRLMYSRNIATFWDAQIGVRQDTRPDSITYFTLGVEGLAPYFFETNLHAFVSEQGDVSLQLRQENELFLTQRLILQPFLETSLFMQDVPYLDTGAGLSEAEIGLQLRYEFTRNFAPYARLGYERKFGETASIAIANGHDRDTINAILGVRLLF